MTNKKAKKIIGILRECGIESPEQLERELEARERLRVGLQMLRWIRVAVRMNMISPEAAMKLVRMTCTALEDISPECRAAARFADPV